jgi:hypothetical protein
MRHYPTAGGECHSITRVSVGEGINPYPALSGFAHASLDFLFALEPSAVRPGMTLAFHSDIGEARDAIAIACRRFAVHFEMAAHIFGPELGGLTSWENAVNEFVQKTADF